MSKRASQIVTMETSLKRSLRRHLRELGFKTIRGSLDAGELTKEQIRNLHRAQRKERLQSKADLLSSWSKLSGFFAAGKEVDVKCIDPHLELISSGTWQSELFALASLYWTVPTSLGYGRRLRFLCWDRANGKLIGLIALGDPVFNLAVRDQFIGWSGDDRRSRLSAVMDAYVLGAVPPYNALLGGKLLACLVRSQEVVQAFRKAYRGRKAIISEKRHTGELAVVTTSSSLGRSSVYNRLKIGETRYFERLGETKGFGHFHITESLFAKMRLYLEMQGHNYADGHAFGHGPNWKMRVIRECLSSIGVSPRLMQHGISREVYLMQLGSNALQFLRGTTRRIDRSSVLPVNQIAQDALERWVIPRSDRDQSYLDWLPEDLFAAICAPYGAFKPRPQRTVR